jgi:hypothetical protein
MPRGGARDGAGRPTSDKKRLVIHVTDAEREAILQLVEKLRKAEKQALQV